MSVEVINGTVKCPDNNIRPDCTSIHSDNSTAKILDQKTGKKSSSAPFCLHSDIYK